MKRVGNHLTLAIPVEPGTVPYENVVSYLSGSPAGRVPELPHGLWTSTQWRATT